MSACPVLFWQQGDCLCFDWMGDVVWCQAVTFRLWFLSVTSACLRCPWEGRRRGEAWDDPHSYPHCPVKEKAVFIFLISKSRLAANTQTPTLFKWIIHCSQSKLKLSMEFRLWVMHAVESHVLNDSSLLKLSIPFSVVGTGPETKSWAGLS